MTRFGIVLAFAILLASAIVNLGFGFILGHNSELAGLSAGTARQLIVIALAVVFEFVVALVIFVFDLPNEKLPRIELPKLQSLTRPGSILKRLRP